MHDSHFVLGRDWANRFDRLLAAAQRDSRTVTVADVRSWIDDADGGPRGLPPEIADLVVLTVAAQCDHSITHGGLALEATPGRALDGRAVLRPEQLPEQDEWRRAANTANEVFGVALGSHVSGPEVGALVDRVPAEARQFGQPAARLVHEVEAAYRRTGLTDGHRLATARSVVDLVNSLTSGHDGRALVSTLVGLTPPTSLQAVGRSMKSAADVAGQLAATNWALLQLADEKVGTELRAVLEAEELSQAYGATRSRLESEATRWLGERTPPPSSGSPSPTGTPVQQPTPSAQSAEDPGTALASGPVPVKRARSRSVQSPAELDAVVADLRSELDTSGPLVITWHTAVDEPA
jgi:hypothetical protein